MLQVKNPFQVPASIDSVQDDQGAVLALGALHNLIRSLFVQDNAGVYWVYVMTVVAFVALGTIAGWGLLIACLFKKRVSLLTLHKIPKLGFRIAFPNTTCFTVFSASISAVWFIIFAIHQFRLNQQLLPSELNASMFWMCVLCLPFWFTLYVEAIEFFDLPLLKAPEDWMKNRKVLAIFLRIIACTFAVIVPAFAILASITIGYNNQQDYEGIVAEVMQYFSDSNLSQEGFEMNGSSDGAINVLRRYEEEAVSVWQDLAGVYDNAKSIMLIWASYFGFLLALYLGGAVKLYMAHKNSDKAINNDSISPAAKLEVDVESVIFDNTTVNEKQAQRPNYQFLQKYKHIFSAMLCVMFLVIYSFLAVRLTSLVEMAQITQFVGHFLAVLSMMMFLTSAYTVVHLSIMYANKGQSTSSRPKSNINGDLDPETRSVDTDVTLTS